MGLVVVHRPRPEEPPMPMGTLEGAVVVITGAGRGIGLATARAFAAHGARVALGDVDAELAAAAASSLGGFGHPLDVRDPASFAAFLEATSKALGPIDVLVNNAGIMPSGPFHDEPHALSDTQIDVNLRGVVHGCKLVLPGMLARRRGQVVNVASLAGVLAVPGLAVYCATKHAVVGLTESLREEYRDSGVGFSSVLPAKVTTELASGTDVAGRGVPTASPDEVAAAIVDAVRHDRASVAVPRPMDWLAPLQGIAPRWMLRGLRRTLDDRRILHALDPAARRAYEARIRALVPTPSPSGSKR